MLSFRCPKEKNVFFKNVHHAYYRDYAMYWVYDLQFSLVIVSLLLIYKVKRAVK